MGFGKVEEGVGMVVWKLGRGWCGINRIGLKEGKRKVCGEEGIGVWVGWWFGKEEREWERMEVKVDCRIGRGKYFVVFGWVVVLEVVDDLVGIDVRMVGWIVGFGEFNDGEEVRVDMCGGNEREKVSVCKGGM